ncbi:MAG: transglutaminase TgpA family protein [Gammaproteobacteria bacterium]
MDRGEMAVLQRVHLAWLLAGLGLVVAPHAPRLPLWVPACFVLLGAWRLGALFRGWPLPENGRWLLNNLKRVLALATFAGVYLSYGAQIGRDAGTALLVVLVGLKLVEASTRRDYYLLLFLGYFLVITNFLFSQGIATALTMLLALAVFTAALVRFNDLNGRMSTSLCASLAGRLLAQALPLMLGAFLLFPRIDGPLWGLPKDAHSGLTGLDEEMSPGAISRLGLSDAVAFRVAFSGALPKLSLLYWRGPVLWDSDGRTWTGGEEIPQDPSPLYVFDQALDYAVTLEPHNRRWLFALEMPSITPPGTALSSDLQLLAERPVTRRMRYRASSHPRFRVLGSTPAALARALRLPATFHPRALALARRWREQVQDPRRIISQALAYFREQPFFYTLSPSPLERDTMDEFLFDTRRGFCEHYAAAFTVLMRAAGLPARIVTGYQGGDYNALGGYLVVRQRDAHAWSEVWLEGEGWVRVDPTGAVSPARVEQGVETALAEQLTIIPWGWSENAVLMQWWRRARNTLDAVNHGWNQWVLGYGERRQAQVMQKLGMGEPTARRIAFWFVIVVTALTLATAARIALRRESVQDPAKALYQRFCNRLARTGIRRHTYEGPVSFAQRACTHRPELAHRIRAITEAYVDLRYAGVSQGVAVLRRLVRDFRPGRKDSG